MHVYGGGIVHNVAKNLVIYFCTFLFVYAYVFVLSKPGRRERLVTREPTRFNYEVQFSTLNKKIDPEEFTVLLKDRNKCSDKDINMVIIIQSATENLKIRNILRTTLGQKSVLRKYNATMVFFVGASIRESTMASIRKESLIHGDLIQENYLDTRRNLTYKALSWIKWMARHCASVEHVVQIDDDAFVNLRAVHAWFNNELPRLFRNAPYFIAGVIIDYLRPNRGITAKNYVSVNEYNYSSYPPFCDGAGFLTSAATMLALYQACKNTEYFWIEDLYQTMMLSERIGAYMIDIEPKIHWFNTRHVVRTRDDVLKYFFIFHTSPKKYLKYWSMHLTNA